ncbi:MAG TPA: YIP1 family protein [Verrucomicrobiae bacterium]|jgi:hypothetical protein|nr:YIP1 family protein [Verrucomicrobiae bacterium]
MIKALFFIFEPAAAWDRVAKARRSFGFILLFYLLPMVLAVSAAEGFSLVKWGRRQWQGSQVKIFSGDEMVVYEIAQLLATLAVVFICAQIVKALGNQSYSRHSYTEGFTVAACGLSPLFLLRLLDVFPSVNPWLTWGVGIMLCVATLYQGLPRVMQPDPSQTFGIYLMCAVMFVLVTGLERFVTIWYLAGRIPRLDEIVSQLAKHLPF